jgi:fibronectin-binding autotransporter adhesin
MAGLHTNFSRRPLHVRQRLLRRVLAVVALFLAQSVRGQAQSTNVILDVVSEQDLRAAMGTAATVLNAHPPQCCPPKWTTVFIRLHGNLTLAAPLRISSSYYGGYAGYPVLDTNGFNLTGSLSGEAILKTGAGVLELTTTFSGFRVLANGGILRLGALNTCPVFCPILLGTILPTVPKAGAATTLQATRSLALPMGIELFGDTDHSIDTNGFTVTLGDNSFNRYGAHTVTAYEHERLVKVGAGTLIIVGVVDPGLVVRGGTLEVSSDDSLGVHAFPGRPADSYGPPVPAHPAATLELDGGTLRAGASFTIDRPVFLNTHSGVFDTNGFRLAVNAVGGPGGLTKVGDGQLIIAGANTYSGGTNVNQGTLVIGTPGALPSKTALTIASRASLDAGNHAFTIGSLAGAGSVRLGTGALTVGTDNTSTLFSGEISGSGSLTKTGSGTLTLSGANTYSRGTIVNAGAVIGTTASLQGAIANNSLVGFAQDNDGTFADAINGTGSVVKAGSGTVTFATPQLYTGLTEVAAGQLNVTGLAGSALVDPGATFSGTGTIAGSLTINGMFTTSSPSSPNPDLLQVNGHTTINGAQLTLAGVNATLPRVTTLPLFTSIGGISGQFGAVNAPVLVDAVVTSRGSTAFAILERTDIPFASLATNANGHAAGGALDAARATASADLRSVIREVGALSDAELNTALAQLGGSTSAIALRTGALDAQGVLRSVSDRIIDLRTGVRSDLVASPLSARPRRTGVWFRATVSGLSGDAIRSDVLSRGGLLGIDREFAEGRWLVGAFGGYDRAALTLDAGANALRDRRYRAGVYAATTLGTAYINAALAGADHRVETTRHLAFVAELDPQFGGGPLFGGIDRSTAARYAGHDVTTFVESGLSRTLGTALVQPFAGLDASHVSTNGFAEHGAGSVDLVASDASTTSVRAAVGIRATRSFAALSGTFAPRVEVRYLHELRDRAASVPVAVAGAPMNGFSVTSPTNGSHAVAASAGFVVEASRRLLFSMDYRGVFAAAVHTQAVTLGVAF